MRFFSRQLQWLLWCLFLALWVFIALTPISDRLTRSAGISVFLVLFFGLLALVWRLRFARYFLFAILLLGILIAIVPGSSKVDAASLRQQCARAIQRYEHVRYSWGGESFEGIDCSGLIRRGFIDGCFIEGFRTCNPWLIRHSFYVWWHDCSAAELGDEYLDMTHRIFAAHSINEADSSKLLPSDLAVTTPGGAHVLSYLGDNQWIEADPGYGMVIVSTLPSPISWFHNPVEIVRWRLLEDR